MDRGRPTRGGRQWRRPGALGALAALAVTLLVSTPGHAYCLTRTCEPQSEVCQFDEFGCNISGSPLFWASSCVTFNVQKDGSQKLQIDSATIEQVMIRAFQQWTGADCGAGTFPKIQIVDSGAVSCAHPEYNQSQPNANVVMFRDDHWTHTNAQETIALTTVKFDRENGEIWDADVEINSEDNTFADGNPVGDEIDLNAALTHEAGHFLGLSHSGELQATMYWLYSNGAGTLADDDISAICAAIPPDRTPKTDDCTPRHGYSGSCASADAGCCATAIGKNASRDQTFGLLAFALGVCGWRTRLHTRYGRRALRYRK